MEQRIINFKKQDFTYKPTFINMNKFFYFSLCIFMLLACSKDENESQIIGTWHEYYAYKTSYDLKTGEEIDKQSVRATASVIFRSGGIVSWEYLGMTVDGKYSCSDNILILDVGSESGTYRIEELSSERLVISIETIDTMNQIKTVYLRDFIKSGYKPDNK